MASRFFFRNLEDVGLSESLLHDKEVFIVADALQSVAKIRTLYLVNGFVYGRSFILVHPDARRSFWITFLS